MLDATLWRMFCRACLQLTFTKPHILLLDEPSNHLDIDAVDALIQGLAMFKGGVLMVR
jgi:ATP-binding cassette subfamily F protein 3